jgi:hypothetical protein
VAKTYNYDTMSKEEIRLQAAQALDPRLGQYRIEEEAAIELANARWKSGIPQVKNESVLNSLPMASSVGEFARGGQFIESKALFTDDANLAAAFGFDVTAGTYYTGQTEFTNRADDPRDHAQEAAPITILPTQTINPKRPRTVAAGYRPNTSEDSRKGTLTVIFRDGTYYNYYEVDVTTWYYFKAAPSKGRFIARYLDSHPRGYAEISYITARAQQLQYYVSRVNQIRAKGKSQNEFWQNRRQPSLERRLLSLEREARREYRNMKKANAGGTNPSSNKGKARAGRKP